MQDADTGHIKAEELITVTRRQPTDDELAALLFAWRVVKHVKSNAIVYARNGQTVGVGAGQMSRVDSAKFGAQKAVLRLKAQSPHPTPSSHSLTVLKSSSKPEQPPSSSPAAPSKIRKSSPPLTSSASPWSSQECATSATKPAAPFPVHLTLGWSTHSLSRPKLNKIRVESSLIVVEGSRQRLAPWWFSFCSCFKSLLTPFSPEQEFQ